MSKNWINHREKAGRVCYTEHTVFASLLTALLLGPIPLKKCAVACVEDYGFTTCWYDLKQACALGEVECVDSPRLVCEPRVVNLGPHDDPLLPYEYHPSDYPPPPREERYY